jgi:quercetin dioxygenase-like cupin family protein
VQIVRFDPALAEPIMRYGSTRARSIELAEGAGEAHAYLIYLEAGGQIGPHEAGFGRIFYAVAGNGWVAGADGDRVPLAEGAAAFIERGEVHAKGSEAGLTALMVQVGELTPAR